MTRFNVLDPKTPLLGHHFLEASAGTGKTFAIEHIVARLIEEEDFEIDEILVVTFTRAATRELKMRIGETLKGKPPSFKIQKALALIDSCEVYTIHGFCHRMLKEYAFEAGLAVSVLSEEESDYKTLLKNHIVDFLRTSLPKNAYSAAQLYALKQDKDALVAKILSLLEKEGELPLYDSFETSFHKYNEARTPLSFNEKYLEHFSKIKDRSGNFKEPFQRQVELLRKRAVTLDEFEELTAQSSILSLITPQNQYKKSKVDASPLFEFAKPLTPILEEASSPLCTLVRIAREARKTAREALLEKEVLSPNDILQKMNECLSIQSFKEKVQKRYRAAIIDEFQDTDPIQWNIFKTLFIDDKLESLFLVGDPKQSIYSFRSADIYTYLDAESHVSKKAFLDTNYRSDPALIKELNKLFQANPHFLSLPDAPLLFQPVKHAEKDDRKFPDDKTPVHFFVYETEKKRERSWPSSEIEEKVFFPFIASEILSLTKHDFSLEDFAVLVKDRFQAERLKRYLESHGILAQTKNSSLLFETPMFSLVRSLLEALINPSEIPVKRFLSHMHSSSELLDEELLTKTIADFGKVESFSEALRDLYTPTDLDLYSDYLKLAEYLLEYEAQSGASYSEILEHLLSLKEAPRSPISDTNSVTIMTIHMSKGLEFNVVFALGLVNRYLGREELIRHQKKYLPFDPDHENCKAALKNQEAEKLRQLYVALTRAKHRVYIPLLKDTKNSPIPLGQASPIELFDPIPQDATYLDIQHLKPSSRKAPTLTCPQDPTNLYPSKYLHSYSSLARPISTHQVADDDPDLPKGAETGLLIHSLLETLLKNPTLKIEDLLRQNVPAHFSYNKVHEMIQNALNTPLAPFSFSLSDVDRFFPEVEFLYPEGDNLIKGFIDLIFSYQGKYYLLDWKTNLLSSYSKSALKEAMTSHDYYLQANLYQTALSRFLKDKPIVGTFYVFLRGLPKEGILFLPFKN